jgi:hypothetical protein
MRDHWVLLFANATASAVLVVAGIGKFVVPRPLTQALSELLGRDPGERVVRAVGVVELIAAVTLIVEATRGASAVLVAVLGAAFAVFGAAGLVRKTTLACGCFGRSESRPLGAVNIAAGIGLAAILPINTMYGPRGDYATGVVLTTSLLVMIICLLTHRRLIASLLIRTGTG